MLWSQKFVRSFVLPHYNHWRGNAWGSFKFLDSTKIFIVKQVLRENVQCKVRVECTSYEKSEKEFHPLKVKWMKNMKSRKSREQKDIKRMKMYGKAQFALMESFSLSLLHKRDENSHTFSLRHKKKLLIRSPGFSAIIFCVARKKMEKTNFLHSLAWFSSFFIKEMFRMWNFSCHLIFATQS